MDEQKSHGTELPGRAVQDPRGCDCGRLRAGRAIAVMPEVGVIVGSTLIAKVADHQPTTGRGSEALEEPDLELELLAGGIAFDHASRASSH